MGCLKVRLKVGNKNFQTIVGTPEYLAPEVIRNAPYSKSVDFWNFGCLIYQLLVGRTPFAVDDEDDCKKMYRRITEAQYQIPDFVPADAADLITKLLEVDPAKRLGANGIAEIKEHRFFRDVDWQLIVKNPKKGPLNVRFEKGEIYLRALNVNLDEMVSFLNINEAMPPSPILLQAL